MIAAQDFHKGLISAQISLQENLDEINRINIFPVADNDTGTNLLHSVADIYLDIDKALPFSQQLKRFVDGLFRQASGNSGFILSLLLTALTQNMPSDNEISPKQFADSLLIAAKEAKSHIEQYVDGSLVSYAEDFAKLLLDSHEARWCADLYQYVKKGSSAALDNTAKQNPALNAEGVRDAGALGLHYWLMGLLASLCHVATPQADHRQTSLRHQASPDCEPISLNSPPNHRYCVQATLLIEPTFKNRVDSDLANKGDCNLNIWQQDKMRFHIHTDSPQSLFASLMQYAIVDDVRIDDMVRQYQATQSGSKIAVVTDSSADIPVELKEQHNIYEIPLSITQGRQKMLDGLTVDGASIVKQIDKATSYPKTAAPSLGAIDKAFQYLSKTHEHVFAVAISSEMSGTYKGFKQVAQSYDNVSVIDSKKNSGAHGLVVAELARLVANGCDAKTISAKIDSIIQSKNIFVLVDNFSAMLKSGRVGKHKAWLAKAMNLKPVVGIDDDGKGIVIAKKFSRQSQLNSLMTRLKKMHQETPVTGFNILHVDNLHNAQKLAEQVSTLLQLPTFNILNASPVISLHAGKGALAVAIEQAY